MKKVYPVILSQEEKFIVAYVSDFEFNTQGTVIVDAIEMARDAIRGVGIDILQIFPSFSAPTAVV